MYSTMYEEKDAVCIVIEFRFLTSTVELMIAMVATQ